MASKIENAINEIEEYIENCQFKRFSNTEIIVNKDEIESLIHDLKKKAPREIEEYQKVVANKEEILQAARAKAQQLIDQAAIQTSELISEHEIMLQAYKMANGIVDQASVKAQEILDNATLDANDVRTSAMAYIDDMLAQLEGLIGHYMDQSNARYNSLYESLSECMNIVAENRAELAPPEVPSDADMDALLADNDDDDDDLEEID